MSTTLDRPSTDTLERFITLRDTSAKHVGAEFVGLARVFRNQVTEEERRLDACLATLLLPIRKRLQTKPTIRDSQFQELKRGWDQFPKRFRLSSDYTGDAKYGFAFRGHWLRPGTWSTNDWCGQENGVLISLILLDWDGDRTFTQTCRDWAMVGLHALARWHERPRGRDQSQLLDDLKALIAPRGLPDNGVGSSPDQTIELACPSGCWVCHPAIGGPNNDRMLRVKTYLDR
jgi:hypothetical protein